MSLESLLLALQRTEFASPGGIENSVSRFMKLSEEDSPLQPYLEQLLPALVDLFAAQAGMVWLRAQGSPAACFAIRYHMENVKWNEQQTKKHDRVLQLAWQQRQPMLVESQGKKKPKPSNDEHLLVFGPIIHLGQPVAIIEVLLPVLELKESQRKGTLRAMQLAMDIIHTGLQKRLALPTASLTEAEQQIVLLEKEIESYQLSIQRSIEARLRQFQGWTFGSLVENQSFARMVHKILEEHGLRVRCPECGHPSILRCLNSGNSKHGVFAFDHYLDDGRTFHGGPTTFPAITVVPKPARRVKLNAS